MKALLIHHQGAGGGATARKTVIDAVEQAGWKVRDLARKEADRKAIRSAKAELIVIAGGDGTVAKVLTMLPDRSVPVAIIPTGTANNIARSVGIEGDPETIAAGWDIGRRRRFDIGKAAGPWGCRLFVEGVGFGLFADSLRLAPDVDGGSKLRAGRDALRRALTEAAPLPLNIAVDGKNLPAGLLLAEIMNVALTGPNLRLAPCADPGDGQLHVSGLRDDRRGAMRAWLAGRRDADPPVEQYGGREVTVSGGGVMMRIDDECCWLEPKSEVSVRLEGEPVQLLAPPDRPALAG